MGSRKIGRSQATRKIIAAEPQARQAHVHTQTRARFEAELKSREGQHRTLSCCVFSSRFQQAVTTHDPLPPLPIHLNVPPSGPQFYCNPPQTQESCHPVSAASGQQLIRYNARFGGLEPARMASGHRCKCWNALLPCWLPA